MIPGPLNPDYGRNNDTLDIGVGHVPLLGERCPSSARCCHLDGAVVESPKGRSAVLASQLLQDGRECGEMSARIGHGCTASAVRSLDQKQCCVEHRESR